MRVLVTGGTGFVGQHLIRLLNERKHIIFSTYLAAASKASQAAEMLATQFFHSSGLEVICARPFNHTGPGQSPEFVCSDLARQVAEIELGLRSPVLRIGNLNVQRDFSDVRDVVRAYELLMHRGTPGDVYN